MTADGKMTIEGMLHMQCDFNFLKNIKDLSELKKVIDQTDPEAVAFYESVREFTEARYKFEAVLHDQFAKFGYKQSDMMC